MSLAGYQRLIANTDFSLAEQTSNAWGVNDDITFEYLYNQLRNRKEEGPWHTAFLTLSSHEPFEVPYHRLEDKIPNAFAYTDECLGKFIDRLKQTPAWKDLLVICLPDHGFYYPREGSNAMPRFYHIPLLWLGGAVKQPMQVDKIMNQTDLAATLLGQLGLEHTAFTFSRNVLGSDYKYPFAFYSFNNGFSFRDSTGVTVFDNNSGSILFNEPEADDRFYWDDESRPEVAWKRDCLGNMVMISSGQNSTLTNSCFEVKHAIMQRYASGNGTVESLKMLYVYSKYNSWSLDNIDEHQRSSMKVLKYSYERDSRRWNDFHNKIYE